MESKPLTKLEMSLPKTERSHQEEEDMEMLDRVEQWRKDFIQSAQKTLRETYGYTSATVVDFECMLGRPGHDENDYELTVQVGDPKTGAIGEEGVDSLKMVVHRITDDSLRG